MPLPAPFIKELILKAIPDAAVEIIPLSNDNDHFKAVITSTAFIGKTRIQQHKLVYDALGPKMGGELHALSLQTISPKE